MKYILIHISIFHKKLFSILLLGLLINVVWAKQEAYGQRVFHDKRLKTAKQPKKESRKRLFKMENRENASPTKVDVRTTKRTEGTKDNRSFFKPEAREKTQPYDLGQKEANRPYRPEINYQGYRKSKKRQKHRSVEEANYSGDLKTSSLPSNPGRKAVATKGEKGRSEKAAKRELKGKSQQMQQYSGDLKYSSTGSGKGREIDNAGTASKGKSKRARDQDFHSRSMEMHQFSGFQKVQKRDRGRGSQFEGNLKAQTFSSKTKDFKNKSQRIQQYSGDLKYSAAGSGKGRDISQTGRMAKGRSKRSINQDFHSRSMEMHQFSGFEKVQKTQKSQGTLFEGKMKTPSLSAKTNYFKKLSKKVNQYEGNLRIKDAKHKNLHPSVSYLKGRKQSSREKKEKLRKRKIFWFRFRKNSDQPNSVKQKPGKPKYDSRESEIWYE